MPRIQINAALCQRCGMCIHICPEELFTRVSEDLPPKITRPRACISCGHCVSICPTGAVFHSDFPPGTFTLSESP
jgi:ferredoxin